MPPVCVYLYTIQTNYENTRNVHMLTQLCFDRQKQDFEEEKNYELHNCLQDANTAVLHTAAGGEMTIQGQSIQQSENMNKYRAAKRYAFSR